jgi:hypothetical protein
MVIKTQQPGCTCSCVTTGITCVNCFGNVAPENWQVDISGFVDLNCTGSGTLNTSWVLPKDPVISCRWVYNLSSGEYGSLRRHWSAAATCGPACSVPESTSLSLLVITDGGGGYIIRFIISIVKAIIPGCAVANSESYTFQKSYGSKPDCLTLSSESIPFSSQASAPHISYDGSGATVLLTAL